MLICLLRVTVIREGVVVKLNAVVNQRVDVSPYLLILRVMPNGWQLPEFTPGQFAVLALPGYAPRCYFSEPESEVPEANKLIKRAYSIASSSVDREYVEFYITLVHSGGLTPRLFALEVGSRLWISETFTGLFTINDVPEEVNVVLIATGTGLAPYMSMLRTSLRCSNPSRRIAVVHGARHSWDLGYRSELSTMQRLCSNFMYSCVISRPREEPYEWKGPSGYVQDFWKSPELAASLGFEPDPATTHIFLCGNPGMVECMASDLEAGGFVEQTKKQPGNLHIEKYW